MFLMDPKLVEVGRMTMSAEQDRELWDALVEAEREHAQRRADFYQNARGRTGILKSALRGAPWQQATALGFLRDFPADGPELVPQLVELALSPAGPWPRGRPSTVSRATGSGRSSSRLSTLRQRQPIPTTCDD
jgi:hypothetical protein